MQAGSLDETLVWCGDVIAQDHPKWLMVHLGRGGRGLFGGGPGQGGNSTMAGIVRRSWLLGIDGVMIKWFKVEWWFLMIWRM